MALEIKYERAADLKIADPLKTWADIAEEIKVSERQLRRVRESPEWLEYWNGADKQVMIETLRRKAIAESNAALFKLYFEVTGTMDPAAQEALLHMSDEEFLKEAAFIAEWYVKQDSSSKTAHGASPTGV